GDANLVVFGAADTHQAVFEVRLNVAHFNQHSSHRSTSLANANAGNVSRLMKRILPWLLVFAACRDEQAGPKSHPGNAPPTQAQPAQPQPGQPQPQGAVRTLDAIPPQVNLTFKGTGTWDDGAVAYLGTLVEPAMIQGGAPVRLTHFFRADKPPPRGWKF